MESRHASASNLVVMPDVAETHGIKRRHGDVTVTVSRDGTYEISGLSVNKEWGSINAGYGPHVVIIDDELGIRCMMREARSSLTWFMP
ncbi:MAG: hypothetical protein QW508_00340 [Conexivisphaerales archaeon]